MEGNGGQSQIDKIVDLGVSFPKDKYLMTWE